PRTLKGRGSRHPPVRRTRPTMMRGTLPSPWMSTPCAPTSDRERGARSTAGKVRGDMNDHAMRSRSDGASGWPDVSVVMPVLNEEQHLAEAVGGVLEQDYPGRLELVLVLGPSHDRTDGIAADLAAADDRVRIVGNPA